MKYFIVWLSQYHTIILQAESREDASKILEERDVKVFPKATLGHEVKVFTKLPERIELS